MEFLKITVKLIIILAMLFLMALPFFAEFLTFHQDKNKKITYKRFIVVVYTGIYVIAITIALCLLKDLILWLGSLSFVQWFVNKVALSSRTDYFGKVFIAILINFGIGFLFVFLSKFVRIGLKKRDIVKPKKKDGSFTVGQKIERLIINYFYTETWFLVGRVLKWLSIVLSVLYALIFAAYQIPAMFSADWIPYDFISMLFSAGYMYPTITLLALWEMYFFLEGIKLIDEECPEIFVDDTVAISKVEADLKEIDKIVQEQFKSFYVCDVDLSKSVSTEISSTTHNPLTEYIAQALENDNRNPKERRETYLKCLDQIVGSDQSVIVNGNFFSEFSMYFLRYMSIVIARGDNIVLVCNSDAQIDEVYSYLVQGLSEISSLYCKDFKEGAVNLDDPIWRIVKVSGDYDKVVDATVSESNILVTSLSYLCSDRFEKVDSRFISMIDVVVFVDTLNTVNMFNRQLSILNTRLKHIAKKNALAAIKGKTTDLSRIRYMSRKIRYICFDDTRVPGLDKALKNMLSGNFLSADAMHYNPSAMVRCYKFEGTVSENGKRQYPNYLNTEEAIGAIMNMAVLCLAKGASSVTVYTDDMLPYNNIMESIKSNAGNLCVKADGSSIQLNKQYYNPDEYSVIIAMDSGDNLPTTLRRYISMASDKPALIIVFSRPYMLRDYYFNEVDNVWKIKQIEKIPVEEENKRDVAQQILVKANDGGISKEEIFRLAKAVPQFKEYATVGDLDSILREVLKVYGEITVDRISLFNYFEYKSLQYFDENGQYNSEVRIVLRRQGKLFESINGRDMVVMDIKNGSKIVLPIPRSRLTQNFIEGQNLVHNGIIYTISEIDVNNGKISAFVAEEGKNREVYKYIQAREYRIDVDADKIEYATTKHDGVNDDEDGVSVGDVYVSAFRAPMEVITHGYYDVKSGTLASNDGHMRYHSINDPGNDALAKQTYRRYGNVSTPYYLSDSVRQSTPLNSFEKGAHIMSIRICGEFGDDINKTMSLAAVMLNEMLRSMFPSVADSIVVCPILHGEMSDDESLSVLKTQPKIKIIGESTLVSTTDFNLVIIEDCTTDLGVVSLLMTSGSNVLYTLFHPIFEYLKWYLESDKKSNYLYFGLDHEPTCFDFASLYKLSKILDDNDNEGKSIPIESVLEYSTCDFCGKRYAKGDDIFELDDGRKMCKHCAEKIVGNNKKTLKACLDRAKLFLESTYGITFDEDYEICFESTVKIVNTLKHNHNLIKRGSDIPLKSYVDDKKKAYVEYSIPAVNLSELLVRELTYVWQLKNLPDLSEDLAEGHIALVAVQYLKFLNQKSLVSIRTTYYDSTDSISGVGYRKLVKALIDNPKYKNNPFLYLLKSTGEDVDDKVIIPPTPRVIESGDYGLSYTPEKPDRALDGNISYFYYNRLTASKQAAYNALLDAIIKHEKDVTLEGLSPDVSEAISFDHPELFWYNGIDWKNSIGNAKKLFYGVSKEERDVIQKRIDEVVPRYLEGIDDSMSAYDVALRLHVKVISMVDYDTIALRKQKQEGGPKSDKIDYLRTICGVFLDGKAVCEGYARAMQYLLQKCGIESAEVAGFIHKENGERDGAHAWNIIKIDGDYYYLDTTWDDSSNTVDTVKNNDLGFDYFCITTEELLRTRYVDLCPTDVPSCDATRANYFYHNDFVLDTYDLNKIKAIAQTAAKNKSKSFTFKCKSKALYAQCIEQMCTVGTDGYEALKAAAKIDKQILTNSYSYIRDTNIFTLTIIFKYK